MVRKLFSDNQYEWMLEHFPHWLMYIHVDIGSCSKMWLPRWGYTKKQITEAEKRAQELFDKLKFD